MSPPDAMGVFAVWECYWDHRRRRVLLSPPPRQLPSDAPSTSGFLAAAGSAARSTSSMSPLLHSQVCSAGGAPILMSH
ncbi:unnamed protein product [Linum trigynum]|uniref:Uncharacterized protein n=1 Tax=Linum trigynum TaxID=586398 RepID=A0AAV2EC05_9ROSI